MDRYMKHYLSLANHQVLNQKHEASRSYKDIYVLFIWVKS